MATQKVILQWVTDSASVAAAKAANASIRTDIIAANAQISLSYEEAAEAAKSVGLSTDEFIKRTGVAVVESQALADAQDNVALSTQAAADATDRLAVAEVKAAAAAKATATGDFFRRAAQGAINLPGIGFASPAVLGLRAGSVLADATGLGLVGVSAALGGIGVAAGLAVLAIKSVTDAEEARAEAAKKGAAAIEEVVRASSGAQTSEDIRQQIADQNAQKQAFQDARDNLLQIQRELVQNTQDSLSGIDPDLVRSRARELRQQLSDLTAGATDDLMTLPALLSSTDDQITAVNTAIAVLNLAFDATATKANDSALASQFFTDGLNNVRQGFFDAQAAGGQFIDAMRAKLQEALDNLNETANSAVDAYMDALQQEVEARDKITAINQQIADLQADAAQKIADAYADRTQKIADAEADAGEKRADIIADGLEKVRQIEKDFARDYTDAVGNRDAVAAYKAKLHRDDELEKQAKADAKRLADVEKALKKQQDAIEKSYNKQVENVTRALNKQLQVQSQALQAANAMLQSALANEAILVSQSTNLHVQYWNDISYITQTGMSQVAGIINGWWGLIRTGLQANMNGGNVPISSLPTGGTAFVQNVVDARLTQVFNRMGRSGGGLSNVS